MLALTAKYHASGNPSDQFVQAEFHEIQNTIQLEKLNSNHSWTIFFKTRGNRRRLLIITLVSFFSQCSGNGLVSYYLHSILESVGISSSYSQSLINGGLQIWSFLVAVGFAFAVDKIGRRKLFMTAAVGMLFSFTIWTAYVLSQYRIRSPLTCFIDAQPYTQTQGALGLEAPSSR